MGLLSRVPSLSRVWLKLFISHSWRYGDHRLGIHDLLQQKWRKGEDFIDLAVPADHPIHDAHDDAELFDMLRERIAKSDVLLVLGGMYANKSAWIETEVTIARALGIPVITVVPYGQERVASAATRFEDDRVRWRGDSIREAILAHAPSEIGVEITRRVAQREQQVVEAVFQALYRAKPKPHQPLVLASALPPPKPNLAVRPKVLTSGLGPPVNRLRRS
jgi:hypothetical protein